MRSSSALDHMLIFISWNSAEVHVYLQSLLPPLVCKGTSAVCFSSREMEKLSIEPSKQLMFRTNIQAVK